MEGNGVTNYQLLREIGEIKEEHTRLETILEKGFTAVAQEVKEMRSALVQGMLQTIKILCYCLVAIIMWVTAIKSLPGIFDNVN